MKIFGFNITRDKNSKPFNTHVAFVSTKRGRKILYVNGKEIVEKNFTMDFWVNDENFAKLDNVNYIKNYILTEK